MKALRLHRDRRISVDDVPIPTPDVGEVCLQVLAAGICGTDVMTARHGLPDSVPMPVTLGHEAVGRVVELGSRVDGLNTGDLVVPEGGWSCGVCVHCDAGRPSVCIARSSLGRGHDGVFAEYVVVPDKTCHKVDGTTEPENAQGLVTVATILRAVERSGMTAADTVGVVGTGHAGLLFVQILSRRYGIDRIISLSTRPERIEIAQRMGAAEVVNVRAKDFQRTVEDWGRRGGVADVVFEASGTSSGLVSARTLTRSGGTIVPYSIFSAGSTIDGLDDFYAREITIRGSRGGSGHYEAAVQAMETGQAETSNLVTHRGSLAESDRLFNAVRDKTIDVIRAVVIP